MDMDHTKVTHAVLLVFVSSLLISLLLVGFSEHPSITIRNIDPNASSSARAPTLVIDSVDSEGDVLTVVYTVYNAPAFDSGLLFQLQTGSGGVVSAVLVHPVCTYPQCTMKTALDVSSDIVGDMMLVVLHDRVVLDEVTVTYHEPRVYGTGLVTAPTGNGSVFLSLLFIIVIVGAVSLGVGIMRRVRGPQKVPTINRMPHGTSRRRYR